MANAIQFHLNVTGRSDKDLFPTYDHPDTQEERISTTFWDDFSIADRFGYAAIKDTFRRAFNEWKDNVKYLVELVIVLNHKCWYYYEKGDERLSRYYAAFYEQANGYAMDTITDEDDARFYFNVTD